MTERINIHQLRAGLEQLNSLVPVNDPNFPGAYGTYEIRIDVLLALVDVVEAAREDIRRRDAYPVGLSISNRLRTTLARFDFDEPDLRNIR